MLGSHGAVTVTVHWQSPKGLRDSELRPEALVESGQEGWSCDSLHKGWCGGRGRVRAGRAADRGTLRSWYQWYAGVGYTRTTSTQTIVALKRFNKLYLYTDDSDHLRIRALIDEAGC